MELHGVDIVLLDDRSELRSMRARGGCRIVRIESGIGVGKIKKRTGINPCQQGRIAFSGKLIPAHVRKFHVRRQSGNNSGENMQSVKLRGLLAGLEQNLKAEANSEKRHAAMDGVHQRSAKLFF